MSEVQDNIKNNELREVSQNDRNHKHARKKGKWDTKRRQENEQMNTIANNNTPNSEMMSVNCASVDSQEQRHRIEGTPA